ncbi:NAD(P)H-dependent oxidoreductase [Clostridium nigeriense]|uniref:NAD(P)H-dependent oxidoreductase n=1 Tax=Clostridium nigeriense TaxID=1805470 RepID=UPI000832320B|nr:NAD(P)H-dependent oxidoreductase [Clostridium nigeriense]
MNKKEILDALNFRYACKEFDKNKKIDAENLNIILESGRLSPSSIGIEPWKFLVVTNEKLKEALLPVCPGGKKQIPSCSHLIILLNRTPKDLKSDSNYLKELFSKDKEFPDELANNMLRAIKIVNENRYGGSSEKMNGYSREQVYLALGTMLATSSLLGIDSCAIGGFDSEALTKILVDNNLLDTEHFNVCCMLALGYRNEEAPIKTRRNFKDVVQFVE